MADDQETTSHKRQDESDDESGQMCLQPGYSIGANRDCLEHIFMRMDIKTLLSVAHSSKLFETLAVAVFKRKFGAKTIELVWSSYHHHDHQEGIDRIRISGLKLIFPLLRVFGAEITKLDVHYIPHFVYKKLAKLQRSYIDDMMWRIDEYINIYCADTLCSLKFIHKMKFPNDFAKPFQMIERVCIASTRLNDEVLNFVDWFPNMQHLEMEADSIDDRFIRMKLPHVKHLIISFDDLSLTFDEKEKSVMNNVDEFLYLNQQLQSFELKQYNCLSDSCFVKIPDLLAMVKHNSEIIKLILGPQRTYAIGHGVKAGYVDRILKEHPNLVELEIKNNYVFEAYNAITLVRQLNALKNFRFDIRGDEYEKFIEQLASDWECTSEHKGFYHNMDLHRK